MVRFRAWSESGLADPASRAAAGRIGRRSRRPAAGVPRSYPRARRRRWRPRRRARARRERGGEDDPEMTRRHPREGEGEGEGEEGGEGNVQRAGAARAFDGAPPTATHVPAACDHVVPVPHPAGTSRRGKADVRSEARKRLASSQRDARTPRPPPRSQTARTWASPSPPFASARRPARPPGGPRRGHFHRRWRDASRAFAGGPIPADRRPRPRKDGRTNKKESVFRTSYDIIVMLFCT